MEKKILFPQIGGIMHGGDYNPEQWLDRPDILEEDIRMMKKAGMNCATLGVFSWSTYEPREGEFHFAWLHDIMDKLYANGIYTILATPSGARPAWLDETYPECRRVDSYGVREHHGVRHNHCMSAPVYRKKVSVIVNKLADEFGNHPGLLMWHISNEFGGECYCPHCVKRFQDYLAEKFDHDIEKLNKAWWTTFWSHTYNDFSQIEPPYRNGEFSIMGLNLEWKRFTTWNMTDYMKAEIAILKERTPQIPVTTNFMKEYNFKINGNDYTVGIDEAAFYGPKLDIQYKNVYGKEDTLVTIQIDMLLAERFGMYYIDENGEKKLPYIIHRTSLGCYERTLAYLIEEYAGALPTWMAPEQVRFLPVTDRAADYCAEQAKKLEDMGFRVEVDYRNEKIGRKIRDAQMEKVPYMVVVGDRDMENGTVSPRHRADGDLGAMSMDEFSALLKQVVDNKEKK